MENENEHNDENNNGDDNVNGSDLLAVLTRNQ